MLLSFFLAASSLSVFSPVGLRELQARNEEAALAVRLGFMTEAEWPGGPCLCPPSPSTIAALDDTQRARLEAFSHVLLEAARRGLILRLPKGECLCH